MSAGPIGPTWQSGSWPDTAWEDKSWQSVISGASTARIVVSASGLGLSSQEAALTGIIRHTRPAEFVLVHRSGGSIAAISVSAISASRAAHAHASTAHVSVQAIAAGSVRRIGHVLVRQAVLLRARAAGTARHSVPAAVVSIAPAIRTKRQRYRDCLVTQQAVVVSMPDRVRDEEDDVVALLEVA